MLFNTSDNPYKTYTELDNLSGMAGLVKRRRDDEDASARKGLAAAPSSVEQVILAFFLILMFLCRALIL